MLMDKHRTSRKAGQAEGGVSSKLGGNWGAGDDALEAAGTIERLSAGIISAPEHAKL